MLKNMAIHELALLVNFFGVSERSERTFEEDSINGSRAMDLAKCRTNPLNSFKNSLSLVLLALLIKNAPRFARRRFGWTP